METVERAAVVGSPDLETLTTSHVERVFLTVRQELKRFQRKGLGYSKDLDMHKAAVAMHFGIYNYVRFHKTLGTTPAVAAGVELAVPSAPVKMPQIPSAGLRAKHQNNARIGRQLVAAPYKFNTHSAATPREFI